MDINSSDFDKCRICLHLSHDMKNLFAQDCKYKFIIEDFIGIELEEKVELPSMICNKCVEIINILLEFKATCIKSQQELLKNTEINLKDMIKTEVENAVNEIETFDTGFEIFDCSVTTKDQIQLDDEELHDDSHDEQREYSKRRTTTQNDLKSKLKKNKFEKSVEKESISLTVDKEWEKEESSDSACNEKIKNRSKSKKVKLKANVNRKGKIKQLNEKLKTAEYEIGNNQKKLRKVVTKKNIESAANNNDQIVKKAKPTSTEPEMKLWRKYAKSYEVPCHICGKLYAKFKIQYHINTHLDVRPFICEIEECKKAFSSPNLLRQHKVQCHSSYAPYVCDVCGKAFKKNHSLRIHKTYHKDPEIPCTVCGKLLRNRKTMKRHMFSHTEERPYKCNECSKCFKNQWSLKVHAIVHTKERPFICTVCGMSFGYTYQLKLHNEKNHPHNANTDTTQSETKSS